MSCLFYESSHHSSVDDVQVCNAPLKPDDSQVLLTLQSSSNIDDKEPSVLSIECNGYPSLTNNLTLQADSDLTNEDDDSDPGESFSDDQFTDLADYADAPSNVLTSKWTLPLLPTNVILFLPLFFQWKSLFFAF